MANPSNKPDTHYKPHAARRETLRFRELMQDLEKTDPATRRRPAAPAPVLAQSPQNQVYRTNKTQQICKIPALRGQTILETYKSPGLKDKEMQRLKQGKIFHGRSIDLHGNIVDEALPGLATAIQSSRQKRLRCILVICGKGLHSYGGKAVLKDVVRDWLTTCPDVLAYCQAKPRDGGSGALYVLLKTMRKP